MVILIGRAGEKIIINCDIEADIKTDIMNELIDVFFEKNERFSVKNKIQIIKIILILRISIPTK